MYGHGSHVAGTALGARLLANAPQSTVARPPPPFAIPGTISGGNNSIRSSTSSLAGAYLLERGTGQAPAARLALLDMYDPRGDTLSTPADLVKGFFKVSSDTWVWHRVFIYKVSQAVAHGMVEGPVPTVLHCIILVSSTAWQVSVPSPSLPRMVQAIYETIKALAYKCGRKMQR